MVKDEFVVKFGQIVDSIIQNKTKVEQRLQIEKTKRDELNKEYIDLVELQRLYFMAVKQFKEVSDAVLSSLFGKSFHSNPGMQEQRAAYCSTRKPCHMTLVMKSFLPFPIFTYIHQIIIYY